ncbi:MAG: hypothetical protein Barrevirus23_6 [Barrevirus sp.]|uniref:Uncharacterized protein n=1 Tax=Barrevirus sp. TaxID=2487763 RepID=A0A3G4ZV00_9VIRU|nr:MAG: hypothetical protein Barrevirus23_6 [Barrevirus sp.]
MENEMISWVNLSSDNNNEATDDEVVFEDIIEPKKEKKEVKEDGELVYNINYDKITTEKYRVFRLRKMDPISYLEVEPDYAFKFPYIWDPYTGEEQEAEPEEEPEEEVEEEEEEVPQPKAKAGAKKGAAAATTVSKKAATSTKGKSKK